ncbi:MAG: GNAT family N-acetyltransferase [Clostridia bacterium]|nr:GNAT family N-acetyltransferase [Clostridia bacterium]
MQTVIKTFNELSLDELFEIIKLRIEVFVVEQNCPYMEVTAEDKVSHHVYLRDESGIVAYLRVVPKGYKFDNVSLGRVITKKRKVGLGAKIMQVGKQIAKQVYLAERVIVEAQTYARGFYEKCGFTKISNEFSVDGIPHILMECNLS